MRRAKVMALGLVLLSAGFLLASAGVPRRGPDRLVLIPKDQVGVWDVLRIRGIDVRQELETAFLALADREDLVLLRKSRIRFSVVVRNAGGRKFFLVPAAGAADRAELASLGKIALVEPSTVLFWTETGDPLSLLPSGLPRKPLASRSIGPYLRPSRPLETEAVALRAADPLVDLLASRVSGDNLLGLVQSLQDFQTRFASTANCEAAGTAISNYFQGLGLDVSFQTFSFGGGYTSRNVIAENPGESYPEDVLIICGHYDSISPADTRLTLAPGADDNGSGTAAVMEAARILADVPLDFSVRFIAFSAEEWGLFGSGAYAAQARRGGERILGVINLDMIAYADAVPEDLEIIVNSRSDWLAVRLGAAANQYAGLVTRKTVDASITYSDHSPFWDNGYPALLAIEDYPVRNPYYHRTTDTADSLNLAFFEASARAALALLAELAQPLKAGYPETPLGLAAETHLYTSLFNSVRTVRLSWTGGQSVSGYNVYRTDTSHLDYARINGEAVTGTTFTDRMISTETPFYYVVTAVDASGLESNASREVEALFPAVYLPPVGVADISAILRGGGR